MNLTDFFHENPRAAIAFSGGVDSAYLLYAAMQAGADVTAYYVKTAFQPEFEYRDALRMAQLLHAPIRVLEPDVLCHSEITDNPPDRCYYCKRVLFSLILERAGEDGYSLVLDGTNASDDVSDRPGMRALKEMCVRSPLREAGLTKDRIRQLSKEAGLFTWDKPSYACLATRIPSGDPITAHKLAITEQAEKDLAELGFRDFRVRYRNGGARIQVKREQMPLVIACADQIRQRLGQNYSDICLDLEARNGQ